MRTIGFLHGQHKTNYINFWYRNNIMQNKYLLAIVVLIGLILLAVSLDPNFTGYVIFDNSIKDDTVIKVSSDSFKVKFEQGNVKLISGSGEIVLENNKEEVFNNKIYKITDLNEEQKTAKLFVNSYDLDIDIKRAVDKEELSLGETVAIRTVITNNEPKPVGITFIQHKSDVYTADSKYRINEKEGVFKETDKGYEIEITLQPNKEAIIDYAVTLINPDAKNTAIPEIVLRKEIDSAVFELKAPKIDIKVKPILETAFSNTEKLGVSKNNQVELELNNLNPAHPITINELSITLPESISLTSSDNDLIKTKNTLTWKGNIANSESLQFNVKSDAVLDENIVLGIKYNIKDTTINTNYEQKISFDVTPLIPTISLNKNSFKGGEEILITHGFTNEEQISFKDLHAQVSMFTDNINITKTEISNNKEIVLGTIAFKAPFSDKEKNSKIIFSGWYSTINNKEIKFEKVTSLTIEKSDFEKVLEFTIIPIGYQKGTMQFLANVKNNQGSSPVSTKIVHDAYHENEFSSFEVAEQDVGVVFERSTYDENKKTIKNLEHESYIIYSKNDSNNINKYILSYNINKDLKELVKEIKSSKNNIDLDKMKLVDYSSGKEPVLLTSNKELMIYESADVSFNVTYMIIIILLIFVGIAGFILYDKHQKNKNSLQVNTAFVPRKGELGVFEAPSQDKGLIELEKFIKYSRENHIPDEKTKRKLQEKGWMIEVINEFLR